MKNIKFLLRIISILGLYSCTFCVQAEVANAKSNDVNWSYVGNTGPIRWGQLNPAFALCSSGKSQSPININKRFKTAANTLTIQYQSAPLEIVNDGDTTLTIGAHLQTITNKEHAIKLNFPEEGPKETIVFQGNEYHLVQFHLHSPSETTLKGQKFPMEIHFVHQGEGGRVAVIAVLVKAGAKNAELQKIIQNFPKDHGALHIIEGEKINPAGLIPAKHDYYHFLGSLTTPPCTEGLEWLVMPDYISASAAQIVLFRKAVGGDNARPIQPRNKREVTFSAKI